LLVGKSENGSPTARRSTKARREFVVIRSIGVENELAGRPLETFQAGQNEESGRMLAEIT